MAIPGARILSLRSVVDLAHELRAGLDHTQSRADTRSPRAGGTLVIVAFIAGAVVLVLGVSMTVISRFSPEGIRFGLISTPTHAARAAAPAATGSTSVTPPTAGLPLLPPGRSGRPGLGSSPVPSSSAPPSSRIDAPGASTAASAVTLPSPTTVNTSPGSSPNPSPDPSASSTTPAPPPNPDSLPVNAPGGSILVDAVRLGLDPTAPRTVELQGLRPPSATAAVSYTFVDWGDASGKLVTNIVPATPLDAAGLTLSHDYASDGTYMVSWGYSTDQEHRWTDTITVGAGSLASAPEQLLGDTAAPDDTATFAITDVDTNPWAQWTLDYGDGTYVWGIDTTRPSADQLVHHYDGTGHTAVLTVIGTDGQLTTSRVSTP